ncbi:thymidylate kinase [Patescibacteria group bacterium]|nr:thymidylate kinase [Patescibacteria group bacterium]
MTKGRFFAIEGTDGSGKSEQILRLVDRLKKENYPVSSFDFPRYSEPSAWFASQYLQGGFGAMEEINPKTASLFYALDRYAAAPQIRAALAAGRIVVSDRYVASNLAHQGSRVGDGKERQKYFQWDYELEYDINCIPKPDLNIILHVPAEVAAQLIAERNRRSGKRKDLHESDLPYLKRTEEAYQRVALSFPRDFVVVECVEDSHLMGVDDIHEKIWEIVKSNLSKQ